MLFGKLKGLDNEWGFDVFDTTFDFCKEITDEEHEELINEAISTGKLISGDKEGNPILIDPPKSSKKTKAEDKIEELIRYLRETDWYVLRFVESGTVIPKEITSNREEARKIISSCREMLAKY